jgi:hypothetical protein
MNRCLIVLLLLVFPSMAFSEEPADISEKEKIKELINDFYSSSSDTELNHRFELLCDWDKKILVKDRIISIWAHQLHSIELKNIKKISINDKVAEVLVEIDLRSILGEDKERKIVPVYVKKEHGQWKIAYLYFQPPLFIMYP